MIHLKHVTVRKNQQIILDDVSLDIEAGQHTAIVGPNGAGKSTLIKVLTKDIHPLHRDDLVLTLYGKSRWHIQELKSRLGIITPDLQQMCRTPYSARDIILSGFFNSIGLFHRQHTITGEMNNKTEDATRFLGITPILDKRMNTLSSGEARKVLIARALIHDPESMILDEPSSNLDLPAQKELRSLLSQLADQGKTVILITHDLADILPQIDRVVCMKEGKIYADGRKEDVLTETALSNLYDTTVYLDRRNGFYKAWC